MNKVLVMGGTEFISRAILLKLIKKGYEVDFVTRGQREIDFDGYHKHLIADRKNKEQMKAIFKNKNYDYIFDVSAYTKEDVEILVDSLDTSSLKRYIFVSSGAVYKPTTELMKESDERGRNENWKEYGFNKKLAEDYLMNLYKETAFPYVTFRPSYIYGEGNNLKRESFLFSRAVKSLPIVIPVSGEAKVQFIHIKDVVQILLESMDNKLIVGEAFNLTDAEQVDWLTLVQTINEVAGTKVPVSGITEKGMSELNVTVGEFFPFRDITYVMDNSKLLEYGLPLPKILLKEGLEKAYKWCEESGIFDQYEESETYKKVIAFSQEISSK